jgi:hypothetical protein
MLVSGDLVYVIDTDKIARGQPNKHPGPRLCQHLQWEID